MKRLRERERERPIEREIPTITILTEGGGSWIFSGICEGCLPERSKVGKNSSSKSTTD